MKRTLVAFVLPLAIAAMPSQQASAWFNFQVGAAADLKLQGGPPHFLGKKRACNSPYGNYPHMQPPGPWFAGQGGGAQFGGAQFGGAQFGGAAPFAEAPGNLPQTLPGAEGAETSAAAPMPYVQTNYQPQGASPFAGQGYGYYPQQGYYAASPYGQQPISNWAPTPGYGYGAPAGFPGYGQPAFPQGGLPGYGFSPYGNQPYGFYPTGNWYGR